jgi:hypothetical protein
MTILLVGYIEANISSFELGLIVESNLYTKILI